MGDLILLVLIFYGVPALCAIVSIFRTGSQKTELQLLQIRVRELETKLAGLTGKETVSTEAGMPGADNASPAAVDSPEDACPAFTYEKPTAPEEPASPAPQTDWRPVFTAQGMSFAPPDAAEPDPSPAPEKSVGMESVDEAPRTDDSRETKSAVPGVLTTLWGWFQANPILYVGLAVFLTGMALTLNFLTQHGYLTEELRLGAAGLVGFAFLGGGWKLQQRNALVAQALMGGGAVILYLTLFMAARLQVLGMGMVFGGMVAVVIGTTLLAVKIDAQLLAVLSTAGGFAVPVLLATDSGNHIGLFSYYVLLSAGNLLLLRFRAWDIPALLSFAAVSLVGGLWAGNAYRPHMFPEMEAFLLVFFLIFSVIQLQLLRHAKEQPSYARRLVHASYLFGLPLAAFGCQYMLTRPYLYADALSALGLAAWHLALRYVYRKEDGPTFSLARDAFLILGVGFSALSVPLALHAPWITCTWALQGAGLVWLGLRQERRSLQWAGYVLQLFGLQDLVYNFNQLQTPVLGGITNGFVIGVLALCLSALAILRELHSRQSAPHADTTEDVETTPLHLQRAYSGAQIWAMGTCWLVVYFQIDCFALSHAFTEDQWVCCLALYTAAIAFIWFMAGLRFGLRLWLYPVQGIWLLLFVYLPWPEYWSGLLHPLQGAGLAEPLQWADFSAPGVLLTIPMAHYAMQRTPELWRENWLNVSLIGLWLLTIFFGVYQWGSLLYPGLTLNPYAAFFWMLLPVAALLALLPCLLRRLAFLPLYAQSGGAVYGALSCVLTAWLTVAFAVLCSYDGRTLSGYLPLFSWVDVTQLLLLAAITGLLWRLAAWRTRAMALVGFVLFVLITIMAARTVCAFTDVPYTVNDLLHDPAFRFVLSVLWGSMALGLMLTASRFLKSPSRILSASARRPLWYAGAALLLLTVLKLLLLDTADRSTAYRMVSFLSLGLLMLGMGYFCPLPPKMPKEQGDLAKQEGMD